MCYIFGMLFLSGGAGMFMLLIFLTSQMFSWEILVITSIHPQLGRLKFFTAGFRGLCVYNPPVLNWDAVLLDCPCCYLVLLNACVC